MTTSAKKISTKEKIIKSALRCFGKGSIEQIKLIDIAKEAGINHSLVLYHYPNFDDILYASTQELVKEYINAFSNLSIKTISDPEKYLYTFIKTNFELASQSKRFRLWLYLYYKSAIDERFQVLLKMVRSHSAARLKDILISLAKDKKIELNDAKINKITSHTLELISGKLIIALSEGGFELKNLTESVFNSVNNQLPS